MSHRSLLSTIIGLFVGSVLIAAAGAQTSVPAPSTPDTQSQAAPSAQPASPVAPSANAPAAPSANAPAAQSSTAQQGTSSQGGSQSVEDELQLTQDQKQKIAVVVDDENKQIAAVRDDNSLTMQQKQQKALQIRQESTPKIKAVLTPEQLQKLAAIQQRMRSQGTGQSAPQSQSPQSQPAAPPQR